MKIRVRDHEFMFVPKDFFSTINFLLISVFSPVVFHTNKFYLYLRSTV